MIDTDIAVAELYGKLRAASGDPSPGVELRLIRPKSPIGDDVLTFDPATIERLIRIGYLDVCRVCNALDGDARDAALQPEPESGSIKASIDAQK